MNKWGCLTVVGVSFSVALVAWAIAWGTAQPGNTFTTYVVDCASKFGSSLPACIDLVKSKGLNP